MRYVEIAPSGYPSVNRQEIRNSLALARVNMGKPIIRKSNFLVSPCIDCFGHLYAEFAYRILSYLLEKVENLPKVPKKYPILIVVDKFVHLLREGHLSELRDYYEAEFAACEP